MPIMLREIGALWVFFWRNEMPEKDSGIWRNKSPMSREYRKGGKLYRHGGGTELGKEAKSYKEYVKKISGGGMTSPAMKKKKG
jgi:hypothetical protein